MGPSSSPTKGHSHPYFSSHVYRGQTTGWIKMPLGMKVGLSPGNAVFDADPAQPPRGRAPQFSAHVCCDQTAGWIKVPLGTKVSLGPGHIVLHGHPASPISGTALPNFRSMSIVAKRSPISATAEHLLAMLSCLCLLMDTCKHSVAWYQCQFCLYFYLYLYILLVLMILTINFKWFDLVA